SDLPPLFPQPGNGGMFPPPGGGFPGYQPTLGVTVQPDWYGRLQVVTANPGGAGFQAGLRPGYFILRVDGRQVQSANQILWSLRQAYQSGRPTARVFVQDRFGQQTAYTHVQVAPMPAVAASPAGPAAAAGMQSAAPAKKALFGN
ncbi:MAG: hypothetical protein AAFN70_01905, partial [Planctomycetota bacterium]